MRVLGQVVTQLVFQSPKFLRTLVHFGVTSSPDCLYTNIAVLTWSDNSEDPMELRITDWSYNLQRALQARNPFREPGSSSVRSIEELKTGEGFEVCSKDRVAIWHGGFVEASGRINELSKWVATSAGDDVLAGR